MSICNSIWLLFVQTSFNLAFCCYLQFQFFNWASVPGGRFSNSPTSQSPVVGGNFSRPFYQLKISSPFGLLLYICFVSEIKKYRTVITYKAYFEEFLTKQKQKVREKIFWTFLLIEEVHQIPDTYLKHLEGTNGLYEIRIQLASDIFRIFCFFDEGKLVVLANGFQKKTQKTPKQEITKALKIMEEYYENRK